MNIYPSSPCSTTVQSTTTKIANHGVIPYVCVDVAQYTYYCLDHSLFPITEQ